MLRTGYYVGPDGVFYPGGVVHLGMCLTASHRNSNLTNSKREQKKGLKLKKSWPPLRKKVRSTKCSHSFSLRVQSRRIIWFICVLRLGDAEEVERFQKRLVRRAPGNSTDCFPGVSGFVVLFFFFCAGQSVQEACRRLQDSAEAYGRALCRCE